MTLRVVWLRHRNFPAVSRSFWATFRKISAVPAISPQLNWTPPDRHPLRPPPPSGGGGGTPQRAEVDGPGDDAPQRMPRTPPPPPLCAPVVSAAPPLPSRPVTRGFRTAKPLAHSFVGETAAQADERVAALRRTLELEYAQREQESRVWSDLLQRAHDRAVGAGGSPHNQPLEVVCVCVRARVRVCVRSVWSHVTQKGAWPMRFLFPFHVWRPGL